MKDLERQGRIAGRDELIARMFAARVGCIVSLPHQWGGHTVHLDTPAKLLAYLLDPELFAAQEQGVSRITYRRWLAAEFCVSCAYTNGKGARCRIVVRGGGNLGPKSWKELSAKRLRCHVHSAKRKPSLAKPEVRPTV